MAKIQRTIGLQELLDTAQPESLRAFLLLQARRNLALEVKLRTFLVNETESPDQINKYSEILSLLVHHDTHGRVRLSKRNTQLLREVCDRFVGVQQELLFNSAFKEGWDASIAVIAALNLFLDKNPDSDRRFEHLLSSSYQSVYILLNKNPAPELRQSIYEDLLEIAKRSRHKVYDIGYNAITCLISAATDHDDLVQIYEVVLNRTTMLTDPDPIQRKMWLALLLKVPRWNVDLRAAIPEEEVYGIAHLLSTAQDWPALSILLGEFEPPRTLSRPQLAQWARWKFDLAVRTGDAERILQAGKELLMLDGDLKTYQKIKSAVGGTSLLKLISDVDISDELRAGIYAEERQWDKLVDLIRRTSSLQLLTQHFAGILDFGQEPGTLIIEVANGFVLHTGGKLATEQIQRIMEVLKELKRADLAADLARHLLQEFPGRFNEVLRSGRKFRGVVSNVGSKGSQI